jgi:hypothetical protein
VSNFFIKGVRLLGLVVILTALTSATLPTSKAIASTKTYKVGDRTPTGGTVFYVLPLDTVSNWHYLEVAPNNWNSGKLSNTSFNKAENYVNAYANKSWYVPSSEEFATLASEYRAKRLKNITLKPGTYWTSTGVVTNKQIQNLQAFNTSTLKLTTYSYKNAINGKVLLRVRPIRYFD